MVQHIQIKEAQGTKEVQSLKEIKKSRRTVILGTTTALSIPNSCDNSLPPLTPPLSERASGDVEQLFSPEISEHYESVDLSSDEDVEEWDNSEDPTPIDCHERMTSDIEYQMDCIDENLPLQKPTLTSLRRILEATPEGPLPRESRLPSPPPMTIHDFWANVVKNYTLVHRTMPVFLFHKIRDGGIPSVLRRVVWTAMAGITPEYSAEMNNIYARLEVGGIGGWDKDIGRDLNRTWPEVEMFKEQDGHGQRGLRGVLGGYSVWDNNVGYCQGLGFLVGPLLMQTSSPAEAFTLLTVLMSQPSITQPTGYSLRTLYTPNFPGLLSLIHSFNTILTEQFPTLSNHLVSMGLTTEMYAPQWFLSMFAVTGAPIESILLRIWDLLMMEGSNGGYTMIRVGLALMRLNQDALLELSEIEDGLKLLLSKDLWTNVDANTLIGIAGGEMKTLVSNQKLAELDAEYHVKTSKAAEKTAGGELHAVVGRFYGRLKATATQLSVDTTNLVAPPMLRSLSRASFTSSPQDMEQPPMLLRVQTEGSVGMSRSVSSASGKGTSDNERALHGQIEELVRVLGEVQRKVGQLEIEKDTLKLENSRLREMLTRVAGVIGTTAIEEKLNAPEGQGSTLSDEISEILFSGSTSASSMSTYPDSATEEDLRTQLTETQHTLNQERQANELLQQQLSTTETELARTRTALLDLRSKYGSISRRERTASNHSSSEAPNNGSSLRELKLVVRTNSETNLGTVTKSQSSGSSANSAGTSWGTWFGRN